MQTRVLKQYQYKVRGLVPMYTAQWRGITSLFMWRDTFPADKDGKVAVSSSDVCVPERYIRQYS